MKSTGSLSILALTLASSLASAQFLDNTQYATLPACTSNCPALTGPEGSCSENDWACFCSGVWTQISAAPTQICLQTCTNPADVNSAYQWYNLNCGADNGATAHPAGSTTGSSGNDNNGGSGGSGTDSSSPSESSSSTSSSSSSADEEPQTWWEGHWVSTSRIPHTLTLY